MRTKHIHTHKSQNTSDELDSKKHTNIDEDAPHVTFLGSISLLNQLQEGDKGLQVLQEAGGAQ